MLVKGGLTMGYTESEFNQSTQHNHTDSIFPSYVNSKSFFLKPYRLYSGPFMLSSLFEMISKQPKF